MYMSKDLRTLLGRPVKGKFAQPLLRQRRPGRLPGVALGRARRRRRASWRPARGPTRTPGARTPRASGSRSHPGLLTYTMRYTNRPSGIQQVIEFIGASASPAPARLRLRSRAVRFEKWQALGNDYAIVEERELPFVLTPERVRTLCAPHTGVGSDGVLLLREPGDGERRRRAAHLQPRRLRGGAVGQRRARGGRCTCAATAGPSATRSPCAPPPARSGRASPGPTPARSTWAAPACARRRTSRAGPRTAPARSRAAGREFAFQFVQVGNPQCAIEVEEGLEELDLAALRPADRAPRAVPAPHQRVVLAAHRRRLDPGAHLRARGGGDDGVRHRRHRRRRRGGAARGRQPGGRRARRR